MASGYAAAFTVSMREKAQRHVQSHVRTASSLDEVMAGVQTGVVVAPWCGEKACADSIEEKVNASILGTGIRSGCTGDVHGKCVGCGKEGKGALIGRAY